MSSFDPRADLATLRTQQDVIDTLLSEFSDALRQQVAETSAWSAEQHLAHVTLANELVLRNLKSLATGSGMLIVRTGEAHPAALPFLRQGRLPRGQVQAPRMVQPPERVDRELLLQWLRDVRRELDALDPADVRASELKIPHQLMGPLDAPQWARFAPVHTQHHLLIALEVLERAGALGLPDLARLAPLAPLEPADG